MDRIKGPWIHGFAIRGVGSLLGERPPGLGPLGKINFLVGRNNHGKSTLLRHARYWSVDPQTRTLPPLPPGEEVKALTLVPMRRDILRSNLRSAGMSEADLLTNRWFEIDSDYFGIWVNRDGENRVAELARATLSRVTGSGSPKEVVGPTIAGRCVLIPAFRQLRPAIVQKPELATGEGLIAELANWRTGRIRSIPARPRTQLPKIDGAS